MHRPDGDHHAWKDRAPARPEAAEAPGQELPERLDKCPRARPRWDEPATGLSGLGGLSRWPGRREGKRDMGDIGTERREVEFEPLTDEPVTDPARQPEPAAAPGSPER
jgi:hypothetical protein